MCYIIPEGPVKCCFNHGTHSWNDFDIFCLFPLMFDSLRMNDPISRWLSHLCCFTLLYHVITYIRYILLGVNGKRCGSSLSFCIDSKHCAGSSSCILVRTWSPVLIHVGEDFDVRSGSWPNRERERGFLLLSQISPQCSPYISACWQPFGAITCHAVTDLCVMCSRRTLRAFFVWSGGDGRGVEWVQAQKQHKEERHDREVDVMKVFF